MASAIPARLSPAEGRKFGLTVGGAFLVLAALLWWRGRPAAPVFAALGGVLAAGALLAPTRLGPIERVWMGAAHLISKVTTPIFMGIVYFAVLTPIGFVKRIFGRNTMDTQLHNGSYWVSRENAGQPQSSLERQF